MNKLSPLLTVDEAAMLLARDFITNFDIDHTKDEWVEILCNSIHFGSLAVYKGQVPVLRDDGYCQEILLKSQSELDTYDRVNERFAKITRSELRSWCDSNNLSPEFLAEDLPPRVEKVAPSADLLPDELHHVQKLLEGTHDRQAPELALALRAWLELSRKDIETPLSGGIRPRIGAWLRKHAPQIEQDSAADKRIQTVANWNKSES